jgi:imidazolonepropionase-like amidohydrolase
MQIRRSFHFGVLAIAVAKIALGATGDTALRCGALLDVRTGETLTDAVVLVANGLVVGAGKGLAVPAGYSVVDLGTATCLPGLIDVHDHLTSDPENFGYQGLGISVPRSTVTGVKNARKTLMAGFTTVRNVGADGYADVALRDGIEAGEIEGPHLLVSGPALGITGGHCDETRLAPEFRFVATGVADGPWQARAKVREVVKYGADLIKICASGGVLSKGDQPGSPQYTLEEMQAIVAEAHKLGRKVAAHAHGTESIKDAIRAGIDSVEHCSLIDEEGIRLAREKGTFLVFDIYNDTFILEHGAKAGMLPESLEKERKIGQVQRDNFRKAAAGGARMAFGTDGGVYPLGDNARQFGYMVEYGMKPLDAIRSATVNAAELMGLKDRAGSLEEGRWADVIAVSGNPIEKIQVLEKVGFVMKAGRIYRNDLAAR